MEYMEYNLMEFNGTWKRSNYVRIPRLPINIVLPLKTVGVVSIHTFIFRAM
jgi:hypothetical protein